MKTYAEISNGGATKRLDQSPARPDGLSIDSLTAPVSFYARRGKRLLDVMVAGAGLLLLLPGLLVVALVLRKSLGRGIIFRQCRVGQNGDSFDCLKFRTMEHDRRREQIPFEGDDRRTSHKHDDDPRHTPVGRLLRKYSLDEVPQLINVIRGDMSLVGPRPEMAARADDDFLAHPRHWVRPGLTGPFQVSDLRLSGDLKLGLRKDAEYVGSTSLRTDLGLMLRTVKVIVSGSGA